MLDFSNLGGIHEISNSLSNKYSLSMIQKQHTIKEKSVYIYWRKKTRVKYVFGPYKIATF